MLNMQKFILGTVQLGKKYSKFIKDKVENDEVKQILDHCVNNNILTFDTAQNYGNSENLLSNISNKNDTIIMTKIHFIDNDIDTMQGQINKSLDNLNLKSINILMLHDYKQFKDETLVTNLIKIKNKGFIKKIGVSVYNVNEAIDVLKIPQFTILQIPFNYLDRQWDNIDFLNLINKRKDVEIHIRSIFLQGILLNEYQYWPIKNKYSKIIFDNINMLCEKYKLTKLELSLRYSLSFEWISGIIFGVDSLKQLEDNIVLFNKYNKLDDNIIMEIKEVFSNIDTTITDPRSW